MHLTGQERRDIPAQHLVAKITKVNLVLHEKGRVRLMIWSEHSRVNIDVSGRGLVLEERLHHLVEAKDVVEVADPSRARICSE